MNCKARANSPLTKGVVMDYEKRESERNARAERRAKSTRERDEALVLSRDRWRSSQNRPWFTPKIKDYDLDRYYRNHKG